MTFNIRAATESATYSGGVNYMQKGKKLKTTQVLVFALAQVQLRLFLFF
jgi:hypothetical protein